jgi:hypothetical protein
VALVCGGARTGGGHLQRRVTDALKKAMNPNPLLQMIASSWWVLALRGALAVLFALGAFLWPGLTLLILVVLWGAFALMDGLMALVVGARMRWWSILTVTGMAHRNLRAADRHPVVDIGVSPAGPGPAERLRTRGAGTGRPITQVDVLRSGAHTSGAHLSCRF